MTCDPYKSNIRIVGCDGGQVWHIYGDKMGAEGVELLAGGLDALYEAPVRTVERTPVRMDGAVLRAVKTAVMEPVITVIVKGSHVNPFRRVDGAFREAFDYELDPFFEESTWAQIVWETKESTRWIDVALTSGTTWDAEEWTDPHRVGWWIVELHLKAYVPFWNEKPKKTAIEFPTTGTHEFVISNPTGVTMYQKWVGTRAQWRLPDNSWTGKRWKRTPGGLWPTRSILYPNLTAEEYGIKVDYDPMSLPVRDAFDHNLVARMPVSADYPLHAVPPFTPKTTVEVTATNVPGGGAMMQLIQPRRYRRPWGRV